MNMFMNVIWGVFGGWWGALMNAFFGVFCCLTVVLIPLGIISFKVAGLMVAPFGKVIVAKEGNSQVGKTLATVMNIIWLPFGVINVFFLMFSCFFLAMTIIGIPFALQGVKLMNFLLWPFGRESISKDSLEMRQELTQLKQSQEPA